MTNSQKTSQAASKSGKSKSTTGAGERWNKQELFESFAICTREAVANWENFFHVDGLGEQVLGEPVHVLQKADQVLLESNAWKTLMEFFDYATEGITTDADDMSIVLDAASILALIRTAQNWPSKEWDDLLTMGDARYALDEGEPLTLERVALLANVDIRTVRNAVSAGDLVLEQGLIDNTIVRNWLHGRKGFKPTIVGSSAENIALEDVRSAADFGVFLKKQRERIGLAESGQKLTIFHPCATAGTIKQLEAGVFTLPLDAVFRVADFYQLSKKALLECVMRVFFSEELDALTNTLK